MPTAKNNYLQLVQEKKSQRYCFLNFYRGFWVAQGAEEWMEQLLQNLAPSEVLVAKLQKDFYIAMGISLMCSIWKTGPLLKILPRKTPLGRFETQSLSGFGIVFKYQGTAEAILPCKTTRTAGPHQYYPSCGAGRLCGWTVLRCATWIVSTQQPWWGTSNSSYRSQSNRNGGRLMKQCFFRFLTSRPLLSSKVAGGFWRILLPMRPCNHSYSKRLI